MRSDAATVDDFLKEQSETVDQMRGRWIQSRQGCGTLHKVGLREAGCPPLSATASHHARHNLLSWLAALTRAFLGTAAAQLQGVRHEQAYRTGP
jgi:hypothetical protein